MTIKTITQNNKQLPKKKEVNPKFSLRVKDLLKILKSNSNENKFIITPEQLLKIKEFKSNYSDIFKNTKNWLEFFSEFGENNLPVLFSPFKRNHKNIFDDQQNRARHILSLIKQNPDFELITMDGHGRLIYTLLDLLKKNNLMLKKIHLLDIDNNTNNYHKEMFPSDIFSNIINIPETQDILEIDSFLEKENIKYPLLYLNFCGISCCGNKVLDGKTRVTNFVKKWLENNTKLIISFSMRPSGLKESYKNRITIYGMLKQFVLKEVSVRGQFYTFEVSL